MNLTELQVRASVVLGHEKAKEADRVFSKVCESIEGRAVAEYGEETREQRMQDDRTTAQTYFLSAIVDGGGIYLAERLARASIGIAK